MPKNAEKNRHFLARTTAHKKKYQTCAEKFQIMPKNSKQRQKIPNVCRKIPNSAEKFRMVSKFSEIIERCDECEKNNRKALQI